MGHVKAAIDSLIDAFQKYSSNYGDKDYMTRADVKYMLKEEFGQEMRKPKAKVAIDKMFNDLDVDGNNKMDFDEFAILVGSLASIVQEDM
ncbi:protein S100-P-like [Vanacampus margaritifer]